MKNVLKVVGSILLGLAVTAMVLYAFSPIGAWMCNEDCGPGAGWAFLGFVGMMGTFLSLCALALLFAVGELTKQETENMKYRVNTWYGRRLLAKREAVAIEDNGDPSTHESE